MALGANVPETREVVKDGINGLLFSAAGSLGHRLENRENLFGMNL